MLFSPSVLHTYLFTLSEWTFLLTISWAWWQFIGKGLQHYEQILCVIRLPTGKNETLCTKGGDSLWRVLQPVNQITFLCMRHVFEVETQAFSFVWKDEGMTKRWWQLKWHLEGKNNRTDYLKQGRQTKWGILEINNFLHNIECILVPLSRLQKLDGRHVYCIATIRYFEMHFRTALLKFHLVPQR